MSDQSIAHAAVYRAVASGRLPKVTTQACVDCGEVAAHYDHYKGYAPENCLEVQPRCNSCHRTRHWDEHPIPPDVPVRISAFFTPEMYDRIKEVMRKKGISKSGAVRFLVAKGIDWWDALDSKGREVA